MNGLQSRARAACRLMGQVAVGAVLCTALSGAAIADPQGRAGSKANSPWVDATNSKVRVLSATIAGDEAPALYAAVQLRMKPGWKTYWRNPGDSGVPPSFDWSGSKNLKSAEVLYPIPHRFADASGTAVGYSGEVVFPVKITPEAAGQPVELSLAFDYGLCKDLCIPNATQVDAVIPADLGRGDAPLIETALAQVPTPVREDTLPRIAGIAADLDADAPGLTVDVLFPESATETDLFIESPEVVVPVPKALGPLKDGKQRFSVAFYSAREAAAVKGKPLTLTLVSNAGAAEATWTAK